MAFRKMFSDDGRVMEFDSFIVIIFESVVDKNKCIFGTFYRTSKSFLKKVMEFRSHVSE